MAIKTPNGQKKARILIVDDHPVVRESLRAIIDREKDLEVCASAADGRQARDGCRTERPDAAIIDLFLKKEDGVSLIQDIREDGHRLPILAFSGFDDVENVERALRAGANGFMAKAEPIQALLGAIRRVLRGEPAISDELEQRLLKRAGGPDKAIPGGPKESLSYREKQVFQRIGQGISTKEIAKKLGISVKTIETYREKIKRKLGLKTAMELVKEAVLWVEREQDR